MIALLVVAFEGWFLGWDQLPHGVRLNPQQHLRTIKFSKKSPLNPMESHGIPLESHEIAITSPCWLKNLR